MPGAIWPLAAAATILLLGGCARARPPQTATPPGALYTRSVEQRTIQAGQLLWIRALEPIVAEREMPGIGFSGLIVRDVVDSGGDLLIPHGSPADLLVLAARTGQLALGIHSVRVYGNTYLLRPAGGENPGAGMPLGTLVDGTVPGGAALPPPALTVEGTRIQVPANTLLIYRLERAAVIQ